MLLKFKQIAFPDDFLLRGVRCTTYHFQKLKDRLTAVSSSHIFDVFESLLLSIPSFVNHHILVSLHKWYMAFPFSCPLHRLILIAGKELQSPWSSDYWEYNPESFHSISPCKVCWILIGFISNITELDSYLYCAFGCSVALVKLAEMEYCGTTRWVSQINFCFQHFILLFLHPFLQRLFL